MEAAEARRRDKEAMREERATWEADRRQLQAALEGALQAQTAESELASKSLQAMRGQQLSDQQVDDLLPSVRECPQAGAVLAHFANQAVPAAA